MPEEVCRLRTPSGTLSWLLLTARRRCSAVAATLAALMGSRAEVQGRECPLAPPQSLAGAPEGYGTSILMGVAEHFLRGCLIILI